MKYILQISLLFLLNGCIMLPGMMIGSIMGMNEDKDKKSHSSSSMMKCGGMMKMNHKSNKVASSNNKNGRTTHSKDYIIAKRYCSQCHDMPAIDIHNKEEWRPTFSKMIACMQDQNKLKPDEYETVMIEHYYGIPN